MVVRCRSCNESFEPPPEAAGRSTVSCPRCGRVVIVRESTIVGGVPSGPLDDPGTEPLLEPLSPAEEPTRIGVASQTLSLPPGKRVSVVVLSGPRKGEVNVLQRPRLTIGSAGAGTDVEVPDPEVSRDHAAVECHGSRVVLRDLGSRSGTFLGDERVTQRDVESGSEFRLGGTTFLLLVSDL